MSRTAPSESVTRGLAPGPGGGRRGFVVALVVGAALLQLLWVTVVPPFRASDEFDHAYRASGAAAGQWRATEEATDGRGILVVASESLVRAAQRQCESLGYTGPDNCTPAEQLGDGQVLVGSGAGNYNPLFYWVVGTAGAAFEGASSLYAMRFTGALLCLLLIAAAAWALSRRRRWSWATVGLPLALTPVLLFSTTVAAPNGLEMAAGLALWSSLLSLRDVEDRRDERGLLVLAVVSACVLGVLRMLGPMFLGLIVLTAVALDPGLPRRLLQRHRALFLSGAALVTAAVAFGAYWILTTGSVQSSGRQGSDFSWPMLIRWPLQAIAAFPYRDQPGPAVVYPVFLLAFLALVVAAWRAGTRRERVVLAAMGVAALAVPLVLTAVTHAGRGTMWQGRYGLPFTVGLVVLAVVVLDRRGVPLTWAQPRVLVPGALTLAVGAAASLVKVLQKEQARPESFLDPAWHQPPVLVVVAATLLAYAVLALPASRTRHDH